jgi:hypothetical protein
MPKSVQTLHIDIIAFPITLIPDPVERISTESDNTKPLFPSEIKSMELGISTRG